MVARHMPGLGNPMDMTLPELEEWAPTLSELLQRELGGGGADDHRARVEAEMRRIHA